MSYVESTQLKAFAGVLEKAADRIEAGRPRWTSSSAFCNYHGRSHVSYQPESPTGNYAPLAALTFLATEAEHCEACVMGAIVAVCTLDLVWDDRYDANRFLDELEQYLSRHVPGAWDSIFVWNDKNPQLTEEKVVAFLRTQAAEAYAGSQA